MKKSPLTLSIVTPVYNGEKFISQTIESIISQEGNFYIDYIIIDDGSTDDSLEIIKSYKNKLIQNEWSIRCLGIDIKYFTGPNRGQTQAYNKGFSIAKGDLFAWMNADDYYMPGIFDKIVKLYENNSEIDFIYGDCLKIYENSTKKPSIEPRPRPNETLDSLLSRGNSFELCFFTNSIFNKVGPLDESLQYCVDLDFWFKVFTKGKTLYIPETIGAFRLRAGSKTTTSQKEFAKERKILAKRYGGNIIPARQIYKIRGKIKFLNVLQKKYPKIYTVLKNIFYKMIDSLKYS